MGALSFALIAHAKEIKPAPIEELAVQKVEISVESQITNVFHEKPELMLAIAQAESGMNPNAYNPEWHTDMYGNRICQGSFGLFQIGCVNYNGDPQDLYDVELNIEIARQVYDRQGIRAWGVCRNKLECY